MRGVARRIHLWELVEGGSHMLSTRFAEFAATCWCKRASSTGISAMYVSQQALMTNSVQARITLERLAHVGLVYANGVAVPRFELDVARADAIEEHQGDERRRAHRRHRRRPRHATRCPRWAAGAAAGGHPPSGWGIQSGAGWARSR